MSSSSSRNSGRIQRESPPLLFEWKQRGQPGFNRSIHQIVNNYKDALGCEVGNDFYWNQVIVQDATAIVPTSKTPITHVVLAMTGDHGNPVVGFALIRAGKLCLPSDDEKDVVAVCKADQPSWYIEFICTQKGAGFGRTLMHEIQRAAIESRVEYLCLSALPSVVMFYHHLGYRLTLNLECLEKPVISELAARIREDIRRRKDMGMPQLENIDDLLADPAFSELLVHAVREKLSMVRNRGDACTDTKSCVEDGVYMMMCLPRKEMQLGPARTFSDAFRALPNPVQMNLEDDPEYVRAMTEPMAPGPSESISREPSFAATFRALPAPTDQMFLDDDTGYLRQMKL